MNVVRVVAVRLDGGHETPRYGVRLICGIDDARRIVPGEWFGCAIEDGQPVPFMLTDGRVTGDTLRYGDFTEATTIGRRTITAGELFGISDADGGAWTYRIRSVHDLASPRTEP